MCVRIIQINIENVEHCDDSGSLYQSVPSMYVCIRLYFVVILFSQNAAVRLLPIASDR